MSVSGHSQGTLHDTGCSTEPHVEDDTDGYQSICGLKNQALTTQQQTQRHVTGPDSDWPAESLWISATSL